MSSAPPPWDSRSDAVANQAKAFQAIDQSILARQVAIPSVVSLEAGSQVEPIPLRFDKANTSVTPESEEADSRERLMAGDDGQGGSVITLSEDGKAEADEAVEAEEKTVSVSHVLTNVIILQSFLFELASLVQVRAGLFDEVRFT